MYKVIDAYNIYTTGSIRDTKHSKHIERETNILHRHAEACSYPDPLTVTGFQTFAYLYFTDAFLSVSKNLAL